MAASPAIETHDLHMHYGSGRTEVRALDGVDLTIQRGEMVAIMGPSGSGKSTLLHIVGALESPTSGTIAVGVHDPQDVRLVRLAGGSRQQLHRRQLVGARARTVEDAHSEQSLAGRR